MQLTNRADAVLAVELKARTQLKESPISSEKCERAVTNHGGKLEIIRFLL